MILVRFAQQIPFQQMFLTPHSWKKYIIIQRSIYPPIRVNWQLCPLEPQKLPLPSQGFRVLSTVELADLVALYLTWKKRSSLPPLFLIIIIVIVVVYCLSVLEQASASSSFWRKQKGLSAVVWSTWLKGYWLYYTVPGQSLSLWRICLQSMHISLSISYSPYCLPLALLFL